MQPQAGSAFVWIASAFALATFISSALSAHLIGLLTTSGLSAQDAVLVGSLIGPMQVAGRVMEFAFTRRVRALFVGTLAFALLVASLLVLAQVRGIWIIALAFALLYGWSNGVMTIVRGTVAAELFGPRGYGAPLALTLVFFVDASRNVSLWVLVGCAALALYAYQRAVSVKRADTSKPLR